MSGDAPSPTGCAREYERTGGIGTYETLALLVGGRRGLPRDLALELAANFAATWGVVSGRAPPARAGHRRARRGRAAAAAVSGEPARQRTKGPSRADVSASWW